MSRQRVPLEMVPIPSGKMDLPFTFDMSMGVRPGDEALRAELERTLEKKQVEIRRILKDYAVPLVNQKPDSK